MEIKDFYFGCFPEKDNERDYDAHEFLLGSTDVKIKDEVDLLPYATGLSQGATVSCTAQGLTNIAEIEIYRLYGQKVEVDAWWQWENQLKIDNPTRSSNGDHLTSALKAANQFGFKISKVYTEGDLEVGDIIKMEGYGKITKDENTMKFWHSQGKGIYTASPTYMPGEAGKEKWTTWTYAKSNGFINLSGVAIGGHAYGQCGYNKDTDLSNKNSWGENWGFYKNGSFFSTLEDMLKTYSAYIIFLKEDKEVNVEKAKLAREKKVLENRMTACWHHGDSIHEYAVNNNLRDMQQDARVIQGAAHRNAERLRNS